MCPEVSVYIVHRAIPWFITTRTAKQVHILQALIFPLPDMHFCMLDKHLRGVSSEYTFWALQPGVTAFIWELIEFLDFLNDFFS